MKQDKTYIKIIEDIKNKYGVDYTNYFKKYSQRIQNLKKGKGQFRDISFYLNKKAKRISQVQNAIHVKATTKSMSDKQLRNTWNKLSSQVIENPKLLKNKSVGRTLRRFQREDIRRKLSRATNEIDKRTYQGKLEEMRMQTKTGRFDIFTGISSYAIHNTDTMLLEEYMRYMGINDEDEAMNNLQPLRQVIDGIMSDGYIDEEEKIIVYTK